MMFTWRLSDLYNKIRDLGLTGSAGPGEDQPTVGVLLSCNEYYTTKVCSNCGSVNDPGASKIYRCGQCGLKGSRDANGSRNILLKKMIDTMHPPARTVGDTSSDDEAANEL